MRLKVREITDTLSRLKIFFDKQNIKTINISVYWLSLASKKQMPVQTTPFKVGGICF